MSRMATLWVGLSLIIMTGVSSEYVAYHDGAVVPRRFAVAVRDGSIAAQTARRADRQPVDRPSVSNGEFANAVASVGPRSCHAASGY